jgi:hypothetical protein
MKTLKAFGVLAAILAMAGSGHAANNDYATVTVHGRGQLNFQSYAGTQVAFELGAGQFVADMVEAGVEGGIDNDDNVSTWRVGGYGHYNYVLTDLLFPYLGAKLSLAGSDLKQTKRSESNTGLELDLRAGVNYFVFEDLSIDSMLSVRVATDDLYVNERSPRNTEWRILFGLKYYFDL